MTVVLVKLTPDPPESDRLIVRVVNGWEIIVPLLIEVLSMAIEVTVGGVESVACCAAVRSIVILPSIILSLPELLSEK